VRQTIGPRYTPCLSSVLIFYFTEPTLVINVRVLRTEFIQTSQTTRARLPHFLIVIFFFLVRLLASASRECFIWGGGSWPFTEDGTHAQRLVVSSY